MSTPFQDRLMQIVIDSAVSSMIAMGDKLGLFQALAEIGTKENAATAEQIAEKAGCKSRYVKEWASALACADIIEVTEDQKFYIKSENVQDLCGGMMVAFSRMTPLVVRPFDKMVEVVKKDGPFGLEYSEFIDFYAVMSKISEKMHTDHLFTDLLPLCGNQITERLEKGDIMSLDVGCGNGFHSALLAERYPSSNFTGIDVTLQAVLMANEKRKNDGKTFENLAFIQMDASKMDADWTGKYDFVTIWDACHDQMRPDLCLKEIHRILKPGGVFAMIEIKASGDVYQEHKTNKSVASLFYSISMMHCLPVGSNSEEALCLGAMWGKTKATQLLKEAGFDDVQVLDTPFFPLNVLYLCKK